MEVTRGHQQFLPITWEPNAIERWDCCHCVCLRKAHRMMYNLTFFGHRVTLPWLDLRSSFDLDLSRSNYTWFDAPWRDKHDGIKIVALPLKLKILSSKNRLGKFWNFDPWWPNFWPEPKMTKWFRNDFSRAFERRFPFCSTMRRSRDRRGVFKHPPSPSRWWKIQRPSRARVKRRRKEEAWSWYKLSELTETLNSMKKGKTPGSNGFPVEFFRCFWVEIGPFLHRAIRSSLKGQKLPTHREGVNTLVPKKDKSPHSPKGWRPITLLNTDYKIISTVISNRLKTVGIK